MNEKEKRKGLGGGTFILMLVTALFFDGLQALLQLIPVAGQILASGIGLFAYLTFFLWFMIKGARFLTAGRIIAMTGTLFVELIPIVNALPVWTISIVLMFITSKLSHVAPALGIMKK